MTPRTLVLFLSSLIAAAWAVQLAAIRVVGDLESPAAAPWLLGTMLLPALWSLAWLRLRRERWQRVAWRLGRPWALAVAPLVPALLAFVALALFVAFGWASSPHFDFAGGAPAVLEGPWLLGHGAQGWPLFALNVALTAIFFGAMNGLPALGEELGWRGLLQGALIDKLGLTRGVALLGLVWSFWHLPSLLAGYNFPEHPLLGGFVLFPLQLVGSSFVLAWLTLRGRSFWPAALCHGSVNGIQDGVVGLSLAASVPRLQIDLALTALELTAGALCWWSLVRRPPAQ
jgi:membrane protease YdiL (CAAX protease family)